MLVIWGHSSFFLFDEVYSFHMPLFFFLSGCFFKWNTTYRQFIKKKISQLIIPYIIFFLLSYIFYIVLLGLTHRLDTAYSLNMLKGLIPFGNEVMNSSLWFLYTLFWMSIIYMAIRKICSNNFLILIICLGLHLLEYVMLINNIKLPFFFNRSLESIIYMHWGYWLYHIWTSNLVLKLPIWKKVLLFLFSFFLWALIFHFQSTMEGIVRNALGLIVAFTGIMFSFFLCSLFFPAKRLRSILTYLGSHTLCLFALHMPLLEIARPCAKLLWGINNLKYDITVFCLSLLLSVIIGEILMMIFPRYLGVSSFSKKISPTT